MVSYNLPFTTCHELSHLRGFMQEEEANFIGFLACVNADDMRALAALVLQLKEEEIGRASCRERV